MAKGNLVVCALYSKYVQAFFVYRKLCFFCTSFFSPRKLVFSADKKIRLEKSMQTAFGHIYSFLILPPWGCFQTWLLVFIQFIFYKKEYMHFELWRAKCIIFKKSLQVFFVSRKLVFFCKRFFCVQKLKVHLKLNFSFSGHFFIFFLRKTTLTDLSKLFQDRNF
jgi:hypothetical protein